MNIRQTIRSYADQPITHQLISSLLTDYKRPNDKIHSLLNLGLLKPVRKGLYIAGEEFGRIPEQFLMANHIFGPSYISMDAALSYYGLIPERVYEVTSITTKTSRQFNTPLGVFSYIKLPLPYYAIGIQRVKLADDQYAMIASPEKALFDKIVTSPGILLRSKKEAAEYLIENLRMDEDFLKEMNTTDMLTWLPDAPKRNSLLMTIKAMENL